MNVGGMSAHRGTETVIAESREQRDGSKEVDYPRVDLVGHSHSDMRCGQMLVPGWGRCEVQRLLQGRLFLNRE